MFVSLLLAGTIAGFAGQQPCEAGRYAESAPAARPPPSSEICNGAHDDCNSAVGADISAPTKVDMLFLVDVSGSMSQYLPALEYAMKTFVDGFVHTEHRFGMITFPQINDLGPVHRVIPFTYWSTWPPAHIRDALSEGGGHEEQALNGMNDPRFERSWRQWDTRTVIVLITDHEMDYIPLTPSFGADHPERHTIYVDSDVMGELRDILTPPGNTPYENAYIANLRARNQQLEEIILWLYGKNDFLRIEREQFKQREALLGDIIYGLLMLLVCAGLYIRGHSLRKQRLELKIAEANERAALYQDLDDELSGRQLSSKIEALQPYAGPPDRTW